MKTICFIRHAKSSWKDFSLADIDRPLNKRGERDAPFMAKLLRGKQVQAEAIISSPANRARTTAGHFAEAMGIKPKDIIIKKGIYEAYAEDVLNIVQQIDNQYDTILVFGHNPTFTTIANLFTDNYIANVPTCGIIQIEANVESWKYFSAEAGKLTQFYYPKQYFD
ncbi:MAG: histidine phosphatase family protein [Saprospiraceae bacterium]